MYAYDYNASEIFKNISGVFSKVSFKTDNPNFKTYDS